MILPSNNINNPSNPQSLAVQASFTPKNNNVSSSELAKVSFNPAVNVTLQTNANPATSSIPPIYSRPTVYSTDQQQLAPSRGNLTSEVQVENALVKPTFLTGQQFEKSPESAQDNANQTSDDSSEGPDRSDTQAESRASSSSELSPEELEVVEELRARDAEVKAHEQAHKAVGGQYTGAISYSYQSGPDGKRYAVGGEVPIDVAPIPGDPEATISKMTIVAAAATAPAEPSAQDLAVAAQATRQKSEAQAELSSMRLEEVTAKQKPNEKDEDDSVSNETNTDINNEPFVSNAISQIQTISKLESSDETVLDIMV